MSGRLLLKKGLCISLWVVLLIVQGFILEAEAGIIGKPTASGKSMRLSEIRLEFDQVQLEIRSGGGKFQGNATSERILLKGIFGLAPKLDAHLAIGATDFGTASRQFDGDFGPAIGTGLRWTFHNKGAFSLGVGIQTLSFQSDDDQSVNPRIRFHEIETFVGGTFSGLEQVTTYFGALFSSGFGRFRRGNTVYSQDHFGVFVGGDFQIIDRLYLSGEARMINEASLTISVSYHPE
ncbi:MAG: hypothetical protein ABGX83_01800 [Nitrospira sp.]|nr:hypothetical protein [Candidatus Manganitrophaceae bacterium]HIL34449.1 hypothetical protein [Candidatus Manganitrophaceae bacterium]